MAPPLFSERNNFANDAFIQGFSPRKSLGQHFLKNSSIAQLQVDLVNPSSEEEVIEVGGGFGILTEVIAKRAKHVWVYETDPILAEYLDTKFTNLENVTIIKKDVLKTTFPKSATIFISNIPYSISTPLAFKVAMSKFERGAMLVQLEFAQKLMASPGSKLYRASSVAFQSMYLLNPLRKVSKSHFAPPPKVESIILYFEKQKSPLSYLMQEELEQYFLFIKKLFTNKNKTTKSAFKALGILEDFQNMVNPISQSLLKKRIRELEISEFFYLFQDNLSR